MKEDIIKTSEPKIGIGTSLYNAQLIIDAFARGIQNNNCLTSVPLALLAEADNHEQNLHEIVEALGRPPAKERDVELTSNSSSAQEEDNPLIPMEEIEDSVAKRFGDDCLNCDLPFQGFSLDDLLKSLLDSALDFISNLKNILNYSLPNYCHFVYLLSFLCIPDLIKLLALILGYIVRLISSIFIGTFTFQAFIMGIIGAIISAVLQFVMSMINVVLTPINCILEAISSVLDALPTEANLRKNLSQEELGLLGIKAEGDTQTYGDAVNGYKNKLNNTYGAGVPDSISDMFSGVKFNIQKAYDGVSDTIFELIGLKSYMECEPARNGTNVLDKVKDLFELIALANLIRAVIKKRSTNIAYDELCNSIYPDLYVSKDFNSSDPFTTDEIAQVIGDAFDSNASIINSEDGDLAILLEPSTGSDLNGTRLNLFSCSLNEFIRESHLQPIVEEAVSISKEYLRGDGLDPRSIAVKRVNLKNYKKANNDKVFLFSKSDKIANDILIAIDDILSFNVKDNTIIHNAIKDSLRLNPDLLPSNIATTNRSTNETSVNSASQLQSRINITSTLQASTLNTGKPIQLKCGSIKDLENILNIGD